MRKTFTILILIAGLLHLNGNAQSTAATTRAISPNSTGERATPKKGAFFVTPFYQFTDFKKLHLTSGTIDYDGSEGVSTYDLDQDDMAEYNNNYGTKYYNSLCGLKVGYQVLDGLGVSVYVGANHYQLRSFVSDENTETHTTDYPALTYGLSVDYEKTINSKLAVIGMLSANYSSAKSGVVQNTLGSEITSSAVKTMYWEADVAAASHFGNFFPYLGIGFTQQFVNPVTDVQIAIPNDNGTNAYDKIRFNQHYNGSSLVCILGSEYRFNSALSFYVNGTLPNPFRVNLGFRILL